MNRKMTRLALGAKCGGLAASGSAGALARAVSPARASEPNPQALRVSHSRRLIGCSTVMLPESLSLDVTEIRRREQRLENRRPRRPRVAGPTAHELQRHPPLALRRGTPQRHPVRPYRPGRVVDSLLGEQPVGRVAG